MTNSVFVEKLKNIVARKTSYKNKYPYNLGYFDGKVQTFDCWNLVKALIWDNNIDQNYTDGKFAAPNLETGLGDWTANQIVAQCSVVGEDFSDLSAIPAGAFLLYGKGDHAGVYVGEGKCIECTSSTTWGQKGVIYSDVGEDGTRSFKGKPLGAWTKWALLPWIDYEIEQEEENLVESSLNAPEVGCNIPEEINEDVPVSVAIEAVDNSVNIDADEAAVVENEDEVREEVEEENSEPEGKEEKEKQEEKRSTHWFIRLLLWIISLFKKNRG